MKENTIQVQYKDNPVLLDKVLQAMQNRLTLKLAWLDYAFGKAYKITEKNENGKFIYPAFYNGQGEYISLLPNDNMGNFSWFDIYDPQKIEYVTPGLPQYIINGALVVWYNLESIFADNSVKYTEEVKNEILGVLTEPSFIGVPGKMLIKEVYERAENVYKNYNASLEEHFLMYPYAGIRFEFTIKTRELCHY